MGMKQSGMDDTDSPAYTEEDGDTMARERIPYAVAGALLLAEWALLWLVGSPIWMSLVYVGWTILLGAMALVALPLVLLPRKGQAPRGGGVTRTTAVVTTGLYAVIRHPLYLGWMLVHIALVPIAQHWLVALVAVAGAACVYLICMHEERRLLSRFGEEYARYMGVVPRINLLTGFVRLLRRKRAT
jgi:protein-S-isoprenylcysteine O-methyltransferase Ste14